MGGSTLPTTPAVAGPSGESAWPRRHGRHVQSPRPPPPPSCPPPPPPPPPALQGFAPFPIKFPKILGEDVAGIVVEAPEGSSFKPGDRVFAGTGQVTPPPPPRCPALSPWNCDCDLKACRLTSLHPHPTARPHPPASPLPRSPHPAVPQVWGAIRCAGAALGAGARESSYNRRVVWCMQCKAHPAIKGGAGCGREPS